MRIKKTFICFLIFQSQIVAYQKLFKHNKIGFPSSARILRNLDPTKFRDYLENHEVILNKPENNFMRSKRILGSNSSDSSSRSKKKKSYSKYKSKNNIKQSSDNKKSGSSNEDNKTVTVHHHIHYGKHNQNYSNHHPYHKTNRHVIPPNFNPQNGVTRSCYSPFNSNGIYSNFSNWLDELIYTIHFYFNIIKDLNFYFRILPISNLISILI